MSEVERQAWKGYKKERLREKNYGGIETWKEWKRSKGKRKKEDKVPLE